jgi:dTDP-4-dehydrorhamnose reductase
VKALLTGAGGQLGTTLRRLAPAGVEVVALDRSALDVGDPDQVARTMVLHSPDVIINAAGYTAVDRAETERDAAFRVNANGPRWLAEAASGLGARLIHVSTDFVFGGDRPVPYGTADVATPASTYGQSKLAGEEAVLTTLGHSATIVRTSWLYAGQGRNFVGTMLHLLATRDSIDVVFDQVGTPTWANSLAGALWSIATRTDIHGIQHWSDEGVASWYDFAVAIQEEALLRGSLERRVPIRAIRSGDFPTPARRPQYSVLDKGATADLLGYRPAHWRENLRRMLDERARP